MIKYYWIQYRKKTYFFDIPGSTAKEQAYESVIDIHPLEWRQSKPKIKVGEPVSIIYSLMNWKEITKEIYEKFKE